MPYTESMHLFLTLFFFIFGSLLGSFSNVVVLRMAISRSVIFPPSACPKCNHQLHAIDLVPIFSWLFLRGKCRYCKEPISIQYPLVESFMAIIICFSFYKIGGPCLPFICLASGMAIWFIISTIFIREEVLKHQPFIWAVVYSLALKYFFYGKVIFDTNFMIIVGLAVLTGIIAYIKNNFVEFTRWSCLSFLALLWLPTQFYIYTASILLILTILSHIKTKKRIIKWLFFAFQLIGILINIYFTPKMFFNIITIIN